MLRPQVRIRSAHQFPTTRVGTTGLGWGLLRSPYGPAYFKEAHDDGWENYMITFDGPRTALVVMTNSSNGESIFPRPSPVLGTDPALQARTRPLAGGAS